MSCARCNECTLIHICNCTYATTLFTYCIQWSISVFIYTCRTYEAIYGDMLYTYESMSLHFGRLRGREQSCWCLVARVQRSRPPCHVFDLYNQKSSMKTWLHKFGWWWVCLCIYIHIYYIIYIYIIYIYIFIYIYITSYMYIHCLLFH